MKIKKIAAFFAIYVIWGSTYIAIRFGIETIPPLTLSTVRSLIAAILMCCLCLLFKEAPLSKAERRASVLSGGFLIFANGLVCIVEETVPSGIVAVFVGTMPIWIMFTSWLAFSAERPTTWKIGGAMVGCLGIALIAWDSINFTAPGSSWSGFVTLALGCLLWAFGTLFQRKLPKVRSPFRFSALQMLAGGLVTGLVCLFYEAPWKLDWSQVSSNSYYALVYLIIFGSLIAFSAYSWLSREVEPHFVSTYALVNPLIAVFLGALLYQEAVTPKLLLATFVVIIGLCIMMKDSLSKIFKRDSSKKIQG